MGTREDGWGLVEGDEVAGGLTAVKLLGGGAAYEAYLAFDEVTWLPVVVKVLRPSQVDDESSLGRAHAGHRVAAAADGDLEPPAAGVTDRGQHVRGVGARHDDRRLLVDHRVEQAARSVVLRAPGSQVGARLQRRHDVIPSWVRKSTLS